MSTIQRILVPVDFSDASRAALRQAATLAKALPAKIDALHVWEPAPNVTPVQLGWMAGDANAFCASLEADLRERVEAMVVEELGKELGAGVEVIVEAGYVAHSILERLGNQSYGMVVMGTHGRRGLSHLVLGSVAERIVRAAPCPVLTTRAPTEKAEEESEEASVDLETPTHV